MAIEIRRPEEIAIPPEMRAVMARLTPEGAQLFVAEMLEALEQAQAANDLAPVQRVLNAWFRTLILRSDPGYEAHLRAADDEDRGEPLSIEDLRARYKSA
jgi:hypothetical protein